MFSIDEIIDLAVQIERNGEKLLQSAQKEVSVPELASLLQWMEDEERRHVEWFSQLRPVPKEPTDMSHLEDMGKNLLKEMLGDQSFSLGDTDFSKLENINELIKTLIEFEKDTVLFYQLIRSAATDQETQTLLERIISEENRHAQRLKAFLVSES